ncbi:thioesterase domain-containing protein, partial [Pseudomonas sp. LJDD11]|uniref:thioesterase domain-containing protein n=1 Tax=Pseudomonas sp. LJDD11 TaxID=2931984 RepID=UPI00211C3968
PSGKQLAAYLVSVEPTVEGEAQNALRARLREHLKTTLPDYMVPAHLIFLDRLPLSPNGKLDRKALPAPSDFSPQLQGGAARTRLERQLVSIWKETLHLDDVGLDDDFFALGGHSILMLSAVGRIKDMLDEGFAVYDFLMNPTVRKQADFIRSSIKGFRKSVIALNSCQSAGRAIYCLPPGGGSIFSYYSLAHELDAVCPVYGLLNKAFVSTSQTHESWAEMVDYYLDEIVAAQPTGPYRLLGWSTGGALAIDVAHALEQRGQQIEFALLIDPMLPEALSRRHVVQRAELPQSKEQERSLEARNDEAVQFVRAFFSGHTEEQVMSLVNEGRNQGLEDDSLVEFLIKSLAGEADYALYKGVYDNYALMAEVSIGYNTFEKMKALGREFSLKPIQARPECWWSSVNFKDIAALESDFIQECARQGIAFSDQLPVAHERMLFSPELLASLAERVRKHTVV